MERIVGSNTLLIFEPGEQHAVRALEDLIFIGLLHGAPGAQIKPTALSKTDELLR